MIIFDAAKHTSFKKLCRRLRSVSKVHLNKEGNISPEQFNNCELLVISCPQTYTDEELQDLRDYVNEGGSLAVFSCEAETQSEESNINELLGEYGIAIDRTTLVRATYHKYLHPKHALIQNGIAQPEIGEEKHTPLTSANSNRQQHRNVTQQNSTSLSFVYPNGTTLTVNSPAYTLLSSGSTSYPVDCPIAAAWECTDFSGPRNGRVLVVGSSDIFSDEWLDKEENSQLCNVFFRFLLRREMDFDPSLGRSDFEEKECVPDIASLSELVKPCLQENKPLPQDYKSLLCDDLFRVHNDYVPDVIGLYKKLNVPYEPLTLVEPQFECPPPPLRMATHQPQMMDPPPPALELFDLDECFMDVRARLAQLTNRLSGDDEHLNYYIREAGLILGLDAGKGDTTTDEVLAKNILHQIGTQVSILGQSCFSQLRVETH